MWTQMLSALASAAARQDVVRNALLESWLVHQRNLTDFFCGPYSHDDAAAIDYLEWAELCRSVRDDLGWLQGRQEGINKFLSHVTVKRSDPAFRAEVERSRLEAPARLRRVWEHFWGHLSEEQQGWFLSGTG